MAKKKEAKSEAEAAEAVGTGEQLQFPGMEDEKNPKIHASANRYWERMQERKAAGVEETTAQENLLRIMKEEGVEHYKYKDIEAHIDATEKVKVKKTGAEDED